ncbi:unnamed protein product [Protopolystoma xenopodis]|uniref:Uncharacterized protein n=1 Tax=Protopolystoma xenopodis TaxID=117903 RepID=A0A3S4ZVX9_9PLAT|nr:unnamed protein product [Protopolystoma xenopodis]
MSSSFIDITQLPYDLTQLLELELEGPNQQRGGRLFVLVTLTGLIRSPAIRLAASSLINNGSPLASAFPSNGENTTSGAGGAIPSNGSMKLQQLPMISSDNGSPVEIAPPSISSVIPSSITLNTNRFSDTLMEHMMSFNSPLPLKVIKEIKSYYVGGPEFDYLYLQFLLYLKRMDYNFHHAWVSSAHLTGINPDKSALIFDMPPLDQIATGVIG